MKQTSTEGTDMMTKAGGREDKSKMEPRMMVGRIVYRPEKWF